VGGQLVYRYSMLYRNPFLNLFLLTLLQMVLKVYYYDAERERETKKELRNEQQAFEQRLKNEHKTLEEHLKIYITEAIQKSFGRPRRAWFF